MARATRFEAAGIGFVDAGVSGGVWGLENGYALMLGGSGDDIAALERVLRALAPHPGQWLRCGPAGAGHFVKMVHNGIEYGMMQAIAEGFAVLRASEFELDLSGVAELYGHGSVVESRLVEWLERAFERHGPELEDVSGTVGATREAAWSLQAAERMGVRTPVIFEAVEFRKRSAGDPDWTGRVLSALRRVSNASGCH